MTKKEKMYQQIQQHGENLNAIFNTGLEPITLCKKLRTLEKKAEYYTTRECNGEGMHAAEISKVLTGVKKILFPKTFESDITLYTSVFVNGDPRGYALKISDKYVREHGLKIHTDMGGYGILAPEFDGK